MKINRIILIIFFKRIVQQYFFNYSGNTNDFSIICKDNYAFLELNKINENKASLLKIEETIEESFNFNWKEIKFNILLIEKIYISFLNIKITRRFHKNFYYLGKKINKFLIKYGEDDKNGGIFCPLAYILDVIFNFNFLVMNIKCERLNLKISGKVLDIFLIDEVIVKKKRWNSISKTFNRTSNPPTPYTDKPMVSEPLDWGDSLEENNYSGGGYLVNSIIQEGLILSNSFKDIDIFNSSSFRSSTRLLNKMQKFNYYSLNIDSNLLFFFFQEDLINKYMNHKIMDKDRHILDYSNIKILKDWKKNLISRYTLKYWKKGKFKKSSYKNDKKLTYKFLDSIKINSYWEKYKSSKLLGRKALLVISLNYIYNFFIIRDFKSLWSVFRFDYRLRIYIKGVNNHVNSKFYRMFMKFDDCQTENYQDNKYFKYCISRIHSKNGGKTVEENVLNFNKLLTKNSKNYNFLFFRNCYLNKTPCIVFLDATASLLQIISLLINDKKLFNLCNVNSLIINDPYCYIITKVTLKGKKLNLDNRILKDRKFIKHVIMTSLFNSKLNNIVRNMIKINFDYRGISINKLTPYVELVLQVFNNEFPNVKVFLDIAKQYHTYHLEIHKTISLWNQSNEKLEYVKRKFCYKRVRLKLNNLSIYKKMKSKEIDHTKTLISVNANMFHFIDSNLILNVIDRLNRLNIKVLSIHDCIGISPNNIELGIRAFNEELWKIYKKNPINEILKIKAPFYKLCDRETKNNIKLIENLHKFKTLKKSEILNSKYTITP